MKSKYEGSVTLVCKSCGSGNLAVSEDKSYVKCNSCRREYKGGYDELVALNQTRIDAGVKKMTNKIVKDAEDEITKMLNDAFKRR